MRLYFEFWVRSFQQTLTYRAATLAGIFTNGVFGVMIASVFLGFYAARTDASMAVEGWTRDQTITLVWINQSLLMTVYLWGWWEVTRSIQSGAIVTDLLKPYDYFTHWLFRDLGRASAHVLIRGIPTFVIGVLLFDILPPASLARYPAFGLSVLLAVIVSFCLRFIANVFGFWVIDHRGIANMYAAVINIFSGMLTPLAFLPGPMRDLANVMPFRAVLMTPNELYLGHVSIWRGISLQLFWVIALVGMSKWLVSQAEKRLVVQGG